MRRMEASTSTSGAAEVATRDFEALARRDADGIKAAYADDAEVDVMRIENDRIAHNTAYYDGLVFTRQIGMMPPKDSGGEKAMMGAFNAVTRLRAHVAKH